MNNAGTLDDQIRKAAFWSAIIVVLMGVLSLFLPYAAPADSFAERVAWLNANNGVFVAAWIVQMCTMLALAALFAGAAWEISDDYPLRASVAGIVVLLSVVAFIIPKFMAIWSIPLLAQAIAAESGGADMAAQLLNLLDLTRPYSLTSSFDYLGFWLYAVFSLLLVHPLVHRKSSFRIAAIGFGAFGVLFHLLLVAVLAGAITHDEIGGYSDAVFSLILVPVIALAVAFRATPPERNPV
jgi:hypothetical protein